MRGSSNTREFKYVTAKKTRRKTVYMAVVLVIGARKYFARCDTPTEATNVVAEYLKANVNAIKLNKAQRHAPKG